MPTGEEAASGRGGPTPAPAAGARAALPDSVQLLWGLAEPARRGPKPSRSRDELVAAAMAIADAEGLGAVSMARVAADVGMSTMALYRYVASKDELLLLMSDAGSGRPPAFPARQTWRERLDQWARAVRDMWLARPWLLQIPVKGPPAGPNNLAWLEAGLAALAGSPISASDQFDVVLLLSTYARGHAWLSVDLAAASRDDPDSYGFEYGGAFVALLDPERFPALTAILTDAADPPDAPVDPFDVGLEIILDGIARRIG